MIAQSVAEIASKGYKEMPMEKSARKSRVALTALKRSKPVYEFTKHRGRAMP